MASNVLTPTFSLPMQLVLSTQLCQQTRSLLFSLGPIGTASIASKSLQPFPEAPPIPNQLPTLTDKQAQWVVTHLHSSLPLPELLELAWKDSLSNNWIPKGDLPCGIEGCTNRVHEYQHNEGDRTQYYCSDTHARAGWVAARRTAHLAQEHMCTLPNCAATTDLKRCLGCRVVRYCSIEHQKADWQNHKPWCKLFSSN